MSHRICLLPGHGIGPEVIAQAERVLAALDLKIEFERGDIGSSLAADTAKPPTSIHCFPAYRQGKHRAVRIRVPCSRTACCIERGDTVPRLAANVGIISTSIDC